MRHSAVLTSEIGYLFEDKTMTTALASRRRRIEICQPFALGVEGKATR
ncbi:hypothetical protein BH18THE2_BH18THE2_15030 [soil metagenome]